ncbi:MAG TPA: TolC family protein [Gemmataceae bacterium]|nr:TolC family protein [Gemmataceae bacterium]
MAGFRYSSRSLRLRWWASRLCAAGLPLLTAGCAERAAALTERGAFPDPPNAAAPAVPPPAQAAPKADAPGSPAPPADAPTFPPTPVDLDAVFRLASEHNAQIALAREKVHESQVAGDLAAKAWLPKVTAGVGYYRHEGGIQNEDGTLTRSSFGALWPGVDLHTAFDVREAVFQRIDAERKSWQQQGELSRINHEQLLQAAETYIDLLTTRRGESVAQELEKNQRELLQRAKDLEKVGGKALSESVGAELAGTAQAEAKLHQQGDAASAKLAYLLGVDPQSEMVPVDDGLAPISVVDATPLTSALVAQALSSGPGVHELQGLLAAIDCGMAEMQGPKKFLPTVDLCVGEGAFGAGPDASMAWDNRFDVGVQVRWDLMELFKAADEKRLAESKRRQVELTYDDLRGKLTLGVVEAREAILSGRVQIEHASEQIQRASESYRLNDLRLKDNVPGATVSDVVQSLRGLELAHFNYITSVSAYNKAQVRLLLLLGSAACK